MRSLGDLIDSAQTAGKLSADRWQRYLQGAVSLKLEIRPEVRRGDPVPYWMRYGNSRIGNGSPVVRLSTMNGPLSVQAARN